MSAVHPRARPDLRGRRPVARLVPLAAAVVLPLAAAVLVTASAQAGPQSVDIELQGTPGALFPTGDLAPGQPRQACVDVAVDSGGPTDSPVLLTVADVTGALTDDLVLSVEESSAIAGATCAGTTFTTVFSGTLTDFAGRGAGVPERSARPAGASVTRYRITATLTPSSSAQGATATARFVWSVTASSVVVDPVPPTGPVVDPVPPTGPVVDPVPTTPVPVPSTPGPTPTSAGPPTDPPTEPTSPTSSRVTAAPTTAPSSRPTTVARPTAAPRPPQIGPVSTASAPVGTGLPGTGSSAPATGQATAGTWAPTKEADAPRTATAVPEDRGGIFARLPGIGAVHSLIDTLPVSPRLRLLMHGMADSGGFPLLLLLLVLLFLLVQNRLDRSDPKLALAPARRQEHVRFDGEHHLVFDGEFDAEFDAGPAPAPPGQAPRGRS